MPTETPSAEADVAYLRGLVADDNGAGARAFGEIYLAAGLLYGFQCLCHFAQGLGWIGSGPMTVIAVLVSVAFVGCLIWSIPRRRAAMGMRTASKALHGAFMGVGLANLAMLVVFAWVAFQRHDLSLLLFYPAVVFAFQGAAWCLAFMLQRRGWMGAVALGWLAASVGLGFVMDRPSLYLLIVGASMLLLMAVPGWLMIRQASRG